MTTLDKWITIYFDLKLLLLRFSQKYFICVYGSRTDFCFWQENYSRMDHFAISCEQDIGKDKEPKENCNDSFRSTYSRGAIVKEVQISYSEWFLNNKNSNGGKMSSLAFITFIMMNMNYFSNNLRTISTYCSARCEKSCLIHIFMKIRKFVDQRGSVNSGEVTRLIGG